MIPTTPQKAAGWRTEPPVSDPSASATAPAATAAADPPEEPPGTRDGSTGFRLGPYADHSVDEPIANSSQTVFPATIAPASRIRRIAVASNGERQPSRILEPQVVGNCDSAMTSFTATTSPASGPCAPAFASRSACSTSAASDQA